MTHEIIKFGGTASSMTVEQFNKLKPVLLASGKFIEVDSALINISDIKYFGPKPKEKKDYDITKIHL